MTQFRVVFEGRIREEWTVDADNAEEAIDRVRSGKGRWEEQEWIDNPQTTRIVKNPTEP